MPLTPAQTATLKTAITGDTALTAFVTGRDCKAIADYYGAATTTKTFRGVVPAYEIINNTVPADWAGLTAAEKQRYQTLTGAGQVDLSNANVRSMFGAMFGAGTTTRANLIAMAERFATRGENLLGTGVGITFVDVAETVFNPDGSIK